jgi:ATP-binding cassette subfamily F protein 3
MIALRQVTFARVGRPLVIDASVQLHTGWKVGVVGANGCGKSSLFALLAGELHAESGDVELPASWHIARVAQETPALPDSALDFVLDGDVELRRVERELPRPKKGDGEAIGHLHDRYGEIGGYSAKARVAEVLHGLGFTDADFQRPVAEFSGGWRVRLNLARALSCRADLLLLDEPTNHLDLDAVFWLETWLKNTPATLLLISHDRDFLDAVVGQILAIDLQRLSLTTGGYSDYERARAARLATSNRPSKPSSAKIAHLNSFIERFRAKATKARQAQSRIKMLERMETVAAAHVDSPFHFSFREPSALPDPLLSIEKASAGYVDRSILDNITHDPAPGLPHRPARPQRRRQIDADQAAGRRHRPARRRAQGSQGAQHRLLRPAPARTAAPRRIAAATPARLEPTTPEQELRDYLGGFDFRGDMATRAIEPFSGGEKSRLALALLIRTKPNLLLLDEPTNHLDLEMREALTFACRITKAAWSSSRTTATCCAPAPTNCCSSPTARPPNSMATSTTTPPGWPASATPRNRRNRKSPPKRANACNSVPTPRPTGRHCSRNAGLWSRKSSSWKRSWPSGTRKRPRSTPSSPTRTSMLRSTG